MCDPSGLNYPHLSPTPKNCGQGEEEVSLRRRVAAVIRGWTDLSETVYPPGYRIRGGKASSLSWARFPRTTGGAGPPPVTRIRYPVPWADAGVVRVESVEDR